MKKTLAFVCLFISVCAFSQSSDSLLKKYDQQFIYRYGSAFMKGGNKLSFTDLRAEFSASSLSFDLYKKAKKDNTVSKILRIISFATIIGVAVGARNNNRTTMYTFIGVQFVTTLGSGAFRQKSITETDRAIQIRNREVLFPGTH